MEKIMIILFVWMMINILNCFKIVLIYNHIYCNNYLEKSVCHTVTCCIFRLGNHTKRGIIQIHKTWCHLWKLRKVQEKMFYQISEDFGSLSEQIFCFKGNCIPNQKLACFVCYLKITNIFLKNDICVLKQIVQKVKNGIEILVGHAVSKLWIKTVKILFW